MPDGGSKISTLHMAALAWARAGFKVLPCIVNGKEPVGALVPNGFKDATADEATINRWWANIDYNIGVVPGSGGAVVIDLDVDKKTGALRGLAEWDALEGEKPATFTVVTPSGGRHLWFKGTITTGNKKLAPNIDMRFDAGYVVAPPSVIDGKAYEILANEASPW